jgi:hypothetical protein
VQTTECEHRRRLIIFLSVTAPAWTDAAVGEAALVCWKGDHR